ncbi:MAG TPA: class I SAM-dependent methyltransferase [Polyangia bacterium]|nr:class I SAM-dependent methyltransferase [Polyangia bacterium]
MTVMNRLETLAVNSRLRALVQRVVEVPLLLRKGGPLPGGRALEIGCGRGAGARLILERFGAERVVAVDLDPAQVERARAHAGPLLDHRAEFRVGDAARLDFPDASFDAVFDFAVLHHVPPWRQAVAEIGRVLKPGGRFYFEDLLKDLILSRPFRALFDHPVDAQFQGYELFQALRAAGLMIQGEPLVIPKAFVAGVARKLEQVGACAGAGSNGSGRAQA